MDVLHGQPGAHPPADPRRDGAQGARGAHVDPHERIVEALKRDEEFTIPSVDRAIPFEFSPDVVRRVVVWEGG
jgi:hypothetical protein